MTISALILIDIQNDYFPQFSSAKKPLPTMQDAADNAARLLDNARTKSTLVIHIRHIAKSMDAPFFLPGSDGSEIHGSVLPIQTEIVVIKTRPNSFFGTELEATLRENGIEKLVICGAMTQMCIDATTRAAVDLGFGTVVVDDACAASSVTHTGVEVSAQSVHAAIMAPLAASYASVLPTSELL